MAVRGAGAVTRGLGTADGRGRQLMPRRARIAAARLSSRRVTPPPKLRVHMHQRSMVHMHPTTQARHIANAPGTVSRVPNQPKTPNRVIRVETTLWRAAQEKARAEGRTLTSVLVAYLRRYVSTPPRKRDEDG